MTQNMAPEPTNDLSTDNSDPADDGLIIELTKGACGCGCGTPLASKKRRFRMGHDQRLMGMLAEAHHKGEDTSVQVGGLLIGGAADVVGRECGLSDAGIAKLRGYMATEPKARKVRRYESDPARNQGTPEEYGDSGLFDQPKDEDPETALGATVRVKVGRWEYDAKVRGMSQAGKITAIEYVKKGQTEPVYTENFKLV